MVLVVLLFEFCALFGALFVLWVWKSGAFSCLCIVLLICFGILWLDVICFCVVECLFEWLACGCQWLLVYCTLLCRSGWPWMIGFVVGFLDFGGYGLLFNSVVCFFVLMLVSFAIIVDLIVVCVCFLFSLWMDCLVVVVVCGLTLVFVLFVDCLFVSAWLSSCWLSCTFCLLIWGWLDCFCCACVWWILVYGLCWC